VRNAPVSASTSAGVRIRGNVRTRRTNGTPCPGRSRSRRVGRPRGTGFVATSSARIFQAHAAVIGLDPHMLMPENDWVRLQSHGRSLHWDTIHAVEHALSSLKREALSDSEIERFLEDAGEDLALEIERQRRAENRLTYDDLPRMAELILANDKVASLYYNHFAAVIVDEYQDLTPQQLRLVNRIGLNRTTYAGDLAQGIYSFAGAKPAEVDAQIRAECSTVIEFAESHRSSPAVLEVVNSLAPLTHGLPLTCAEPASWPGGGLAGGVASNDVYGEAKFTVDIARLVLEHAPGQRFRIIARTEGRRRFVDEAVEASGITFHRWDDPLLDTDTARATKGVLSRLDGAAFNAAEDRLAFLRSLAELDTIEPPWLS